MTSGRYDEERRRGGRRGWPHRGECHDRRARAHRSNQQGRKPWRAAAHTDCRCSFARDLCCCRTPDSRLTTSEMSRRRSKFPPAPARAGPRIDRGAGRRQHCRARRQREPVGDRKYPFRACWPVRVAAVGRWRLRTRRLDVRRLQQRLPGHRRDSLAVSPIRARRWPNGAGGSGMLTQHLAVGGRRRCAQSAGATGHPPPRAGGSNSSPRPTTTRSPARALLAPLGLEQAASRARPTRASAPGCRSSRGSLTTTSTCIATGPGATRRTRRALDRSCARRSVARLTRASAARSCRAPAPAGSHTTCTTPAMRRSPSRRTSIRCCCSPRARCSRAAPSSCTNFRSRRAASRITPCCAGSRPRHRRAPGLELVAADALQPPFADGAFDTVVTPWFVDIIGEPFARVAARVNLLLKPGGRWINCGSLAFSRAAHADRIGPRGSAGDAAASRILGPAGARRLDAVHALARQPAFARGRSR